MGVERAALVSEKKAEVVRALNSQDFASARKLVEDVSRQVGEDPFVLGVWAHIAENEGDRNRALSYYNRLVESEPNSVASYLLELKP